MTPAPRLEVRNLSRVWRPEGRGLPAQPVLRDVSLTVRAGEFAAVAGPSGCGKSTLLNIIAGLQVPDSGEVLIDGRGDALRLGRVGYVHQRDLLLPWKTALQNATLGLELAGVPAAEAETRARALAQRFGLGDVLDMHPARLSGGMRQRVALLRAVLPDRGLLLLDEPFGALDAITRSDLEHWLAGVLDRSDKAVILVTHDVEEALLLADRVFVMAGPPGSVIETIEVDLPRPRPKGVVTSDPFVALKQGLLSALSGRKAVAA